MMDTDRFVTCERDVMEIVQQEIENINSDDLDYVVGRLYRAIRERLRNYILTGVVS